MRTDRTLRERCRVRLAALTIPQPFSLDEICRTVGRSRGRPIVLVPAALPPRAPCGIWAATDDCDYIVVQAWTSRYHAALIGLHELAHIVLGHGADAAMDGRTRRVLAPHLDPRLIRHMLGRTTYAADTEREAELLASMILSRVGAWSPIETGPVPAEIAEVVARLETSLLRGYGQPPGGRPG